MVTSLMKDTISKFKQEKLMNYHKNISLMSKIQLDNTKMYSELWGCISQNPNIKDYENSEFN